MEVMRLRFGTSAVWRIPPGENNAAKWIDAGDNKGALLGVLADEKSGRLLVCQAGVKTFGLKTGAAREVLTIPTTNPFCNDLALRSDGSIYVTDTIGAKVFMFAKGATTGVEVASDGRTAMGVPDGDSVEITTLKEGGMEGGTPAVTVTKGMGWTMEGNLRQRDARNPDADKGPFRLFPVPLPKSDDTLVLGQAMRHGTMRTGSKGQKYLPIFRLERSHRAALNLQSESRLFRRNRCS
jgi:hypothetical protein